LARALIVGCGCRGRELGSELAGLGWQVRGTSRSADGLDAIAAVGIEPAEADPDRPGGILDLCRDVAVVVWLLGSAGGEADAISALHGPRLERLLEKLVDTPVRGFVYEATGSADAGLLEGGRRIVERAGETWHIPVAFLGSGRDQPGWAVKSAGLVAALLAV
jgi:nucleoside-diphosphate-sugar epimerase